MVDAGRPAANSASGRASPAAHAPAAASHHRRSCWSDTCGCARRLAQPDSKAMREIDKTRGATKALSAYMRKYARGYILEAARELDC
jgi:hypothetical protein